MHGQNESADPGEVANPRKSEQTDRRSMMDEHLPEILPLDVEELKNYFFANLLGESGIKKLLVVLQLATNNAITEKLGETN